MNVTQTTTWRLVQTPAAAGDWNMAVDEALLESVGKRKSLPILRLYAWEPPCISIGYAQSAEDIDWEALHARGWQAVRRPTGGRAILHTDELTYSVIAHHQEPRLAGGVLESYQRLSIALLAALHRLDLPAQALAHPSLHPSQNEPKGPVCFEVPSNYEITVQGKKLIGSAQARRKDGILQHGSLPLGGDLTRITQALVFSSQEQRRQAAQRLLQRATTVENELKRRITWQHAAQAFIAAFTSELQLHLQESELTRWEVERAQELVEGKYSHIDWSNTNTRMPSKIVSN